jgi:hypothetical protein
MRTLAGILAIVVILVAAPTAFADTRQMELARARVPEMPAEDLLFRVADIALPPGQPGVTHVHASGFDFAVEGTHVLTVHGQQRRVSAGQATWVGMQEERTHASLDQAGMRFWFVAVRPASTRAAPVVWPHPSARIRGESEDFRLATTGPHDLTLTEIRLEQPGDEAGPLAQRGPVGVTMIEGQASLGEQALAAEGMVIQRPRDAARLRNTGSGPARLLALAVVPAGPAPAPAPVQLPTSR